jgi:hypothetical protein
VSNREPWICPECQRELGWLCKYCVYCDANGQIVVNPDIVNRLNKENIVTPQEELFAKFFNAEKVLVKDMDVLALRAHREELSKIAFEARARLTAVDDEERARKPKKDGKATGFSASLEPDSIASDAINTVRDRQKRLTKQEKLLENLKRLGIDTKDAESIMSSGKIKAHLDSKEKAEAASSAVQGHGDDHKQAVEMPSKEFFNPFAKKE